METTNVLPEKPIPMPRIGDTAPDFEAVTTKGKVKLSEFAKDKWIVMFSHPADFHTGMHHRNEWVCYPKI